jgi:hypothetical protein
VRQDILRKKPKHVANRHDLRFCSYSPSQRWLRWRRPHATANLNKGDLAGAWVVSLTGNTGCGLGTIQANFVLKGTGTATVTMHAQCGDSVLTGQTFTVLTLSPNGRGTANLSCGTGCGWDFKIQVAPDRSTFSPVDVSAANPGNYLAGVAVHQSSRRLLSLGYDAEPG